MILFPRQSQAHYEENLTRDLSLQTDSDGVLNGQARGELGKMAFGRARVAKAGCESIAVYNALRCLGLPRPLPEIIRDLEQGGYMRLRGHMGAVPWLWPLLKRYGVSARPVLPWFLQRDADLGLLEPGSVYLFAFWNDRIRPQKGMHTIAGIYEPDPAGSWVVFNRFNSDRSRRRCKTLRDVLRSGRNMGAFLVIYRLRRF